jgi:hypothetical protein
MPQTSGRPPPGERDGPGNLSCLESIANFENRPPRPAWQVTFDGEIALALTASGWRVAAHLLILAAKCIEAGDFLSAENNRRQAREQFNTATDVFRQFQEARAAAAGWIGAEAFLRAPP